MRKAGVSQAVIMKMIGHKTAAMFHRFSLPVISACHFICEIISAANEPWWDNLDVG